MLLRNGRDGGEDKVRMRISAVAFVFLAYYGPCGAAIAGGLYTLNCCESPTGDAGDGGGTDAGAAAGGAGGLDDPSIGVGAVDARIGAVLLGEDICQALCGLTVRIQRVSTGKVRGRGSSARSSSPLFRVRSALVLTYFVEMTTSSSRTRPALSVEHAA